MEHRKSQSDIDNTSQIITDGKVYILRYNFISKTTEETNLPYYEYDEILLSKNEFEYHKSLIGVDDNFISNFISANGTNIMKV